jgi:hypothetical protein
VEKKDWGRSRGMKERIGRLESGGLAMHVDKEKKTRINKDEKGRNSVRGVCYSRRTQQDD